MNQRSASTSLRPSLMCSVPAKTAAFSSASAFSQEKDNGWPKVLDIYFENNDTVAFSWEEAITIEDTGMYYLWFVICDDELSAATVRGQTTWKNPTGVQSFMQSPLPMIRSCLQGNLCSPVRLLCESCCADCWGSHE